MCEELEQFKTDMLKKINNNAYKDSDGMRGWKKQSPTKSLRFFHKDVVELEEALEIYERESQQRVIDPHVTEEEMYSEILDVACRALFLADTMGLINFGED